MTEMSTLKSFSLSRTFAQLVRFCSPLLLLVAIGAYIILFLLSPMTQKYSFDNLSLNQQAFQQELLAEKRARVEIIKGEKGTLYLLRNENPKKQTWSLERPPFLDGDNNPILEAADMKHIAEQEPIARPAWLLSGPELITIAERNRELSLMRGGASLVASMILLLIVSATIFARPLADKTGKNTGVEIPELLGLMVVTAFLMVLSIYEVTSWVFFLVYVGITLLYWQSLVRQFAKASST